MTEHTFSLCSVFLKGLGSNPASYIHLPPLEFPTDFGGWLVTQPTTTALQNSDFSVHLSCLIQPLNPVLLRDSVLWWMSTVFLFWTFLTVFWSSLYVQPLDLSPFPFVGLTEIWHLICPLLLSLSVLLKSVYGYVSLEKRALPVPLTTVFRSLPSPIRGWTIL